jgi:hypothetical protein
VSALTPLKIDFKQSRNLACAVRRDWKDEVRCSSSRSSWVLSSWSWGIGREVRSTVGLLASHVGLTGAGWGRRRRTLLPALLALFGRHGCGLAVVVVFDSCSAGFGEVTVKTPPKPSTMWDALGELGAFDARIAPLMN